MPILYPLRAAKTQRDLASTIKLSLQRFQAEKTVVAARQQTKQAGLNFSVFRPIEQRSQFVITTQAKR